MQEDPGVLSCGHDRKYYYFHPALRGGHRHRCAACDDPEGRTAFMRDNPLPKETAIVEVVKARPEPLPTRLPGLSRTEVSDSLQKRGLSISEFEVWMEGRTVILGAGKELRYFDKDVIQFIRWKQKSCVAETDEHHVANCHPNSAR